MESLDILADCLTRKKLFRQTIYVTCVSGIVYCHIHNVPFNSRDQSGLPIIFGSGSREQTELEGWVLSGIITTVGLLFILIGVTG